MKKKFSRGIAPIGMAAVFCAVVIWFISCINSAGSANRSGQLEAVKRLVENGITLCYSIEGAYPENIEYLSENYGVNYDKERYIVHYNCFAANVRPSVTVMEKEH